MQEDQSNDGLRTERIGRLPNGQFTFGNKFSQYTNEEREEQFQAYIIHRSYGKPKEDFFHCSYRDLEKWADSSTEKKEELELAEAKGRAYWSGILERAALGLPVPVNNPINGQKVILKPKDINATLLIFSLKARYPKVYRESATGSNDDSVNAVPRSVPFTIIENGVTEEFIMLGADLDSFNPKLATGI